MRERLVNYDSKYDILYIATKDNRPAIGEEPIDGVVIRRAIDNNEIVGVTIFDVKKAITPGFIDTDEYYKE